MLLCGRPAHGNKVALEDMDTNWFRDRCAACHPAHTRFLLCYVSVCIKRQPPYNLDGLMGSGGLACSHSSQPGILGFVKARGIPLIPSGAVHLA